MDHAWLCNGPEVFDPVLNQFFEVDEYATRLRAVAVVEYTKEEAAEAMLEVHHLGPWDKGLLEWSDANRPKAA